MRSNRRFLTLVLSAALFLGMLLPTASADVGGGGGGTSDGGSTGGGATGVGFCRSGEGWVRFDTGEVRKVYDAPYPKCSGSGWTIYRENIHGGLPNLTETDIEEYVLCPIGWEVWRFYGDGANPVDSYSVSQAGTGEVCKYVPRVDVFFPTPDDAGVNPGWRGVVNTSAPVGPNDPVYPYAMTTYGQPTTLPPFRIVNSTGSCLDNRGSEAAINADLAKAEAGVARAIFDIRLSVWDRWTGPTIANNLANLSRRSPLSFGDSLPCGSGFEYLQKVNPDAEGTEGWAIPPTTAVGACVIPVVRAFRTFVQLTANEITGVSAAWYERGGVRYDIRQPGSTSQSPGTKFTDDGNIPAGAESVWRSTIAAEVRSRSGTPREVERPANAYGVNFPTTTGYNMALAADQASQYAYCMAIDPAAFSFGDIPDIFVPPGFEDPPPGGPGDPDPTCPGCPPRLDPPDPRSGIPSGPRLRIEVEAPEYFMRGGADRYTQIATATPIPSSFTCDGQCSDIGAPRATVNWEDVCVTFVAAPTNGYGDYLFEVFEYGSGRWNEPQDVTCGSGQRSIEWTFYNATWPDQFMCADGWGTGTYTRWNRGEVVITPVWVGAPRPDPGWPADNPDDAALYRYLVNREPDWPEVRPLSVYTTGAPACRRVISVNAIPYWIESGLPAWQVPES